LLLLLSFTLLLLCARCVRSRCRYAVANHDLIALKILLEAGLDASAEGERDAFGRSPLELARLAQDASFDNVLGHLEGVVGGADNSSDTAAASSSSASSSSKKARRKDAASAGEQQLNQQQQQHSQRRGMGDTGGIFFERAGTDVQVNCGVDVVAAGDLTAERFLRDYVAPGRPLLIEGAADDWGMASFKIATFPDELGAADVAANQVAAWGGLLGGAVGCVWRAVGCVGRAVGCVGRAVGCVGRAVGCAWGGLLGAWGGCVGRVVWCVGRAVATT
jgi:hypothetical protein